jgi:calcineurin-like phosphoesterase family protein
VFRQTLFTADEHYFHENIAKYTNRPWIGVKANNNGLIAAHNKVNQTGETVWHIGDFTMASEEYVGKVRKQVIQRLNGIHHLVLGNHDSWKPFRYVDNGFVSVHTSFWFSHDEYTFVLAHDPSIYTVLENEEKTFMLCGHIHKLFQHLLPQKRIINVGVDVWDYKPVSFEQICDLIRQNGWEIKNHG